MAKIREDIGLDFDDVLLVPKHSKLDSRSKVRLDTCLVSSKLYLPAPIISANMDTITGYDMAVAMYPYGVGILHRYQSQEDTIKTIVSLKEKRNKAIPSIGVDKPGQEVEFQKAIAYYKAGADAIVIDIAHGHCELMTNLIKKIKNTEPAINIIAGNIATMEAAFDLIQAGVSALKVGIGPGAVCETRIRTGAGVPQLTAIMDVYKEARISSTPIIADGGIHSSSSIVKALAAGASSVMLGSLLAGTDEALGGTTYRGMASKEAQTNWKGSAKNIEGVSIEVPRKGPVSGVLEDLLDGVRSGFSYCGASNLQELWNNAEFIRVR